MDRLEVVNSSGGVVGHFFGYLFDSDFRAIMLLLENALSISL